MQSCSDIKPLAREDGDVVTISFVTKFLLCEEQTCHWSVLMVSPYFEALYRSGLKERQSGRLTLDFEDETSIRTIIKYMYTGEVFITMDNIRALLRTADYFLLTCFKQSCESFFQSYRSPPINKKNCVDLCLMGSEFDLPWVYQKAFNFIIKHFSEIVELDEPLTFSDDTVEMLLKSPALHHITGITMFNFLRSWTQNELENREKYFSDLFNLLEFEKFTKQQFKSVSNCPLVIKNTTCQKYMKEFQKKVDLGLCRFHSGNNWRDVFLFLGGCLDDPSYINKGRNLVYILEEKWWCINTCMGHNWQLNAPLIVTLPNSSVFMMDGEENTSSGSLHYYLFSTEENQGWSTGTLSCPKVSGFRVGGLVNCGMILYAVCYLGTEWKLYQISLRKKKSFAGELFQKSKLFACPKQQTSDPLFQVLVCAVEDRYIAVHAGTESQKKAYFAFVDTQKFHQSLLYSSSRAIYYPVMFSVGSDVILVKLVCQKSVSFNLNYKVKKFKDCPAFCVKRPLPVSMNRVCFTTKFFYNKLYVFGGLLKGRKLQTCFYYCFRESAWKRIPNMPTPMYDGGMCVSSVDTSALPVTLCTVCNTEHAVLSLTLSL